MERRKNNKTREAVEDALQKRDITDLKEEMHEGFKGVHERQDTANSKTAKNVMDIAELKDSLSFYKGGLAVLTVVVLPLLFFVLKLIFEK